MSDEVGDFKANFQARADEGAKIREVKAKKLLVEENRYSLEIERIQKNAEETAKSRSTDFGLMSKETMDRVRRENIEYIESARKALMFINPSFDNIIPFFRKNLILMCGKSGHGKSTTVANIARQTLAQRSQMTGNPARVLVITNEEKTEDVYNRVTCLIHKWHYVNHNKFTDEQLQTFDRFIPILGKFLTVVDDNYNGIPGQTTSIEGICNIFDNMIRDGIQYDAVIIDYYQNVTYSKERPHMTEFEIQAALCHKLDQYKNLYPAPIILLAQCDPPDDKGTPLIYRIKGRKLIFAKATVVIEMVADTENLITKWEVHKSRFTNAIGKKFNTAYNKGKIDILDEDFRRQVAAMKEEAMQDAAKLNFKKDEKKVDDKENKG